MRDRVKIWIVSFGSNQAYIDLSTELILKLGKIYPDATQLVYGPDDLPGWMLDWAREYPRGFGYWIWKSYVILKVLQEAAEGDLILYLDGRWGLRSRWRRKLDWLDRLLNEDPYSEAATDILAWQSHHIERHYTTADLMAKFGISVNTNHATSGQFAGGILALRVNARSRLLIEKWFGFQLTFPELCRDEASQAKNYKNFTENRHDQSVLSLLLKTEAVKSLKLCILHDQEIYRRLVPHARLQPAEKPKKSIPRPFEVLRKISKIGRRN